jgi:hypothetical protein
MKKKIVTPIILLVFLLGSMHLSGCGGASEKRSDHSYNKGTSQALMAGKDAITVKPKKGESGTMIAKVKKIAGTVANLWEYSLDEGKTWVEMDATSKGTTEITGLKPGSTIIVNNRPVLRKSKGTWLQSQPAIVL